ncbi:MAG: aspartate 1-decarboxylase [Anaeroplasmataceae bacterium]
MEVVMLKSKIHRAVVTQADLNYVGSVTIDSKLLREAGIYEYEKVQIVDIDNGNRFETYTIAGEENSGIICLNGAAAKCVSVGDKVIIMAYCNLNNEEVACHKPTVLFVNEKNEIVRKANYERHGLLCDQE